MKNICRLSLALAVLSACAEDPSPPTVTSRGVDRAFENAARAATLPITDRLDLPTGTVTYDGQIGADVQGDALGSVLADMSMIVGFGTNRISGDISNINLVDQDGEPTQRFDGSLTIAGIENGGNLDAGASGRVTGVDDGGTSVTADMNLDLAGSARDDRGFGDAVYGTVDGEASGDFNLDLEGVFYGERR